MTVTEEPSDFQAFLDLYENHVDENIRPTFAELDAVLTRWADQRVDMTDQTVAETPVALTESRIKKPASVADKINRKPGDYPGGLCRASMLAMPDLLGGRVVTYFPGDLSHVDGWIRDDGQLIVHHAIAYYPENRLSELGLDGSFEIRTKASGYRSIHYIVSLNGGDAGIRFELQVRTLADHTWSAIEHLLGYKPESAVASTVHKQFQLLSAHLAAVDAHFDLLRDEVRRSQLSRDIREDDVLDQGSLPRVLAELGLGCARRDIDAILRMLDSNGLRSVAGLREVARELSAERIRDIFARKTGGGRAKNKAVLATWCLFAKSRALDQPIDPDTAVLLGIAYGEADPHTR